MKRLQIMSKLKQITVRLDSEDLRELQDEAHRLQIKPGTLIRMLIHLIIDWNDSSQGSLDVLGNLQQKLKTRTSEK